MVDTERADGVRTRITVSRFLSVGFAVGCYVGFVAVFLYGIAFLADPHVDRDREFRLLIEAVEGKLQVPQPSRPLPAASTPPG